MKSKIEWTEQTWNPIVGCSLVSPGCTNCYAMKQAHRIQVMAKANHAKAGSHYDGTTKLVKDKPVWTGKVALVEHKLSDPLRRKTPTMYFVNSMSDLFHESIPDDWIDKVFGIMALCPQHTFQVLTKRSKRMRTYTSDPATPFRIAAVMDAIRGVPSGEEEFRPIEGYPGYFVSSHGQIFSEKRGSRRVMKPDAGEQGHLRVQLHREGGGKRGDRLLVHRIVLEAFVGPAPTDETQGRHLDRDPSNNALANLAWGDQPTNWDDRRRHGTFRSYAKLTNEQAAEIRHRHASGETAAALGREFGISDTQARNIGTGRQWAVESPIQWPLPNCWKGVSTEDQQRADERIPDLLATPAAVRFVSAEPLLGPINLQWLGGPGRDDNRVGTFTASLNGFTEVIHTREVKQHPRLDWVIVGGESQDGARPMHPDWARSIRDQCQTAGVPFFFKQWGTWTPGENITRQSGKITVANYMSGRWFFDTENMANADGHVDDEPLLYLVGKKEAGNLLDGREHKDMPPRNSAPERV